MKWPKAYLGDVAQVVSGATPKSSVDHYWDGDIPWITPADLSGLEEKEVSVTARLITEAGLSSCSSRILPPRSVLFSSRAPIGHVAINTVPMATNQGFKSFVPDQEILSSDFLYWWLKSNEVYLQSLGRGATFKEVSKEIVEAIEIPLPPLEEQRRIAAILDKASQLTEACASHQAAHRRMGESLFIQAFGEPRTNPFDLPSARLGAIADCQLGKMLDKKRQSGCSKKPYLRNANVRWFEIDTSDVLFMDIGDHEIDRFGVYQGDLLVCEGGEPGRSAIWKGGNGVIGFQKALHRLRADRHKVLPEYLNWALWMFAQRGLLSDRITSATIAHLTREKLVNINILIPPLPVQERFSRQLEALNALSQAAKSRNQILRSLNSSTFSTLLGWCAEK
ncbi:restriction endonuclease subunit S [Cyanobium sp.]|nr:restriction endonuclease subunit S [Cyanobium sp.]